MARGSKGRSSNAPWRRRQFFSLEFLVWSLEFGVFSLEFGVWSLKFEVSSKWINLALHAAQEIFKHVESPLGAAGVLEVRE